MDEAVALKLFSQYGDKFIQLLKAEGKLGDGQGANSGSAADNTDSKLLEETQGKKDKSGAGPSQEADHERESISDASLTSSQLSILSEQESELSDSASVDADPQLVDEPTNVTELGKPNPKADKPVKSSVKYTVSDYFSKKTNPAKLKMRRLIRKGAQEAEVLGSQTYKDVTPGKRRHIIERVIAKCPELKEHELMVDEVIKRVLIQAKYYRCSKKTPASGKLKEKKSKNKINKQREKRARKAKVPPTKQKPAEVESTYELGRKARIRANQLIQTAVLSQKKTDEGPNAGDDILTLKDSKEISLCKFIRKRDEMYAELVFTENVAVADDLTDIALYEVIPRDQELRRAEKKYVAELEVDDIFIWKTENIKKKEARCLREKVKLKPVDRYM